MKNLLLIAALLLTFSVNAQYFELSWDGEPIGETMIVYGSQWDFEIVAHAILKNVSDHSMDIKVRRERIEMQEGTNSQFCWAGQCFPPNTEVSPEFLTLAPDESCGDEDFSGHYIPEGVWGDSYIKYEFFNMNAEWESISVTVQFSATLAGVDENKETAVSIYPNPADNQVNIKSQNRISEVSIFDLTGKSVYTSTTDRNEINLNIDFLERGLYLIRLETESGSRVEKLTVR